MQIHTTFIAWTLLVAGLPLLFCGCIAKEFRDPIANEFHDPTGAVVRVIYDRTGTAAQIAQQE